MENGWEVLDGENFANNAAFGTALSSGMSDTFDYGGCGFNQQQFGISPTEIVIEPATVNLKQSGGRWFNVGILANNG